MMQPGVLITFDVECSMGGAWASAARRPVSPRRAVWGEYGSRRLGLPLLVQTLADHGLRATFFVEAFMEEQGHAGHGEAICQYLLDHGQDVQLHIHPNHRHYALKQRGLPFPFTDYIADLPVDAQRELLQQGAERIARWTGRPPVAFRAGNMGASETTLTVLRSAGMWIDSSYAYPYAGGQCRFSAAEPYNGARWYGDVLEIALSGFRQPRLPGMQGNKILDLMGVSFRECQDAIQAICAAGADAVAILHSFSLIKVRNEQYEGGRLNAIVYRRFLRLCQWLAEVRQTYPARTFAEIAAAVDAGRYAARAVAPCLLRRPLRAIVRKAVQGVNNLYWV